MMTNNDGKNLPPSLLVTKGVNKFGSLLFKDLEKSKNLVFSPFSLSTALAMLTPGAKEKTLAQVVPSCFQESLIKVCSLSSGHYVLMFFVRNVNNFTTSIGLSFEGVH